MGKENGISLCLFLIIALCMAAGGCTGERNHIDGKDSGLYESISISLTNTLTMEKPLPMGSSAQNPAPPAIIYVLGGGQNSLIRRFRKASSLYRQGRCNKILILSRPGITEYSPDLGRNLTNDEWSIRELERLRVNKGDIEAVPVPPGIFGTLSEAIRIPDIVREKGYRRLVLVTSLYHTRRVFDAFLPYASKNSLVLYIYGADGITGLGGLLSEYVKLFLYDNIILPANAGRKPGDPKSGSLMKMGQQERLSRPLLQSPNPPPRPFSSVSRVPSPS